MKPKGVHCPECEGIDLDNYGTRRQVAGRTDRYLRCLTCGHRWVTEEADARPVRRKPPPRK